MSGTIINAKNPSNTYQPLIVDSQGRLECSVNEIEITAEQIQLNTNDLETLTTAGNNTLSSIDNKVILPSALDSDRLKVYDSAVIGSLAQINNNVDGVETKLDSVITNTSGLNNCVSGNELQVDIVSGSVTATIAGVSTEAKQDTIISTIGDTNNKIDAMRASDTLTTVKTSTDSINSTLSDTNSKIDAMRASDSLTTIKNAIDTTETTLNAIETSLSNVATDNAILSMRVREDEAHVNRQYLIGCGVVRQDSLSSLCDTDNDTTMLSVNASGALYTQPASHEVSLHSTDRTHLSEIESAIETIEGTVGFNKVNVNISSDASGLSTSALQGAGLPSALSSDNLKVSLKETIAVPVTNTPLTNLDGAINSNKVDVNISSGNISGFSTSTLQGAGLPSALSSDNLKVSLKETITGQATMSNSLPVVVSSDQSSIKTKAQKAYTTETSYISSQSVSGSSTHTGSTITNNPNVETYIFEHNFSGSDCSYEIEESIDNSTFFATGQTFNQAGDPTAGITGLNSAAVPSPYFRIKFTNGNASARNVTLSYVTITTA